MITRFAPSPTGPLHLGHAYSALLAFDMATQNNGTFLLRIEDIDQSRARPEWEAQIFYDLHWLGLHWPTPAMRQSDRLPAYSAALDHLWQHDLIYPCTCARRDIHDAISAPQEGVPTIGPDGLIYPGTCRPPHQHATHAPRPDAVLRLNMARAIQAIDAPLEFSETGLHCDHITFAANDVITKIGDSVLARRAMGTSYHLSVVLDDAAQGITHIVRGQDLYETTTIHVILQRLLGLPTPSYHHHKLIRDENGRRLAKRDDARALSKYRAEGAGPNDIRRMVGL